MHQQSRTSPHKLERYSPADAARPPYYKRESAIKGRARHHLAARFA
jgi:hypothetical protein